MWEFVAGIPKGGEVRVCCLNLFHPATYLKHDNAAISSLFAFGPLARIP
jgi:hypothetical protein